MLTENIYIVRKEQITNTKSSGQWRGIGKNYLEKELKKWSKMIKTLENQMMKNIESLTKMQRNYFHAWEDNANHFQYFLPGINLRYVFGTSRVYVLPWFDMTVLYLAAERRIVNNKNKEGQYKLRKLKILVKEITANIWREKNNHEPEDKNSETTPEDKNEAKWIERTEDNPTPLQQFQKGAMSEL